MASLTFTLGRHVYILSMAAAAGFGPSQEQQTGRKGWGEPVWMETSGIYIYKTTSLVVVT